MIDSARIAKNTIFLYVRMILVLGANFYAVRILLDALGVEDYGLFNLIVGFVTLFTFLNGAMQSTVQRFLCYAMGKNGEEVSDSVDATTSSRQGSGTSTIVIFSLCFYLFLALATLIFLVSETAGLWFVYHKLNIPPERFRSAQIVYQLSIVVMLFKTMQIPYTALIISYERMNAFAKISIVEAVLALGAAFAIKWTPGDNLVVYTVLYTMAQAIVCLVYALYSRRHFPEGKILPLYSKSNNQTIKQSNNSFLLKQLSSFFSWSILGAVANMLKQQGLNVLLNIFFGVAFNATWAIANKIGMAMNQLILNFQQAFNPQIIKSWAEGDRHPFYDLLTSSSKFSFMLMWVFALPVMAGCPFFLGVWLKGELPPQLVLFIDLTIVYLLFDALSGPLWMAVQATGKIGVYQLQVSALISSSFVISWILFSCGAPACTVVFVNASVNALCLFYRMIFLRKAIGFPVGKYIKKTLLPTGVTAFTGILTILAFRHCMYGFVSHLLCLSLIGTIAFVSVGVFGLSGEERRFAVCKISDFIRRKR